MKSLHLSIITWTIFCLVIGNAGVYAQTNLIYNCHPINATRAILLANQSNTYAVNSIGYYVTFDHIWCGDLIGNNQINVEFDYYMHGPFAWCKTSMDFQEDSNLNNVTKLINYGGDCQESNPNPSLISTNSTTYDGKAHMVPSPWQQYASGVLIDSVRCKDDFRLIVSNIGLPACVTPDTAQTLIERGWGNWPI